MISWPGVEGIFLIFAMKNVLNKSLHHLLIIVGVITPLLIVFFILGFSFTTNENIYVTTYDADGKLMINVVSFEENMNTICWIRPDYVIRLALSRSTKFMLHPKLSSLKIPRILPKTRILNLPIGLILFSNIIALFTAVTKAYKSAAFR